MHLTCHFKTFHYCFVQGVITVYTLCGLAFADLHLDHAKTVYTVEAVLGGVAHLPCDITPPEARDKMHILIWYKDAIPIYTFDSRGKKLEQGRHWSIDALSERAFFKFQDDVAKLSLNNVKDTDEGSYQCRVDFRRSPTRNVGVNLTVIIPPDKLYILNEHGTAVPNYVLGPYNEGDSINVSCIAMGGRPPPKVTWWQENALLDGSYDYLSERKVRNVLHITHLERKHLLSVFTCQASNNNLIAPMSKSVTLDMNLRPLWVKLLGTNKPLSADNTYELTCEVVGSRPSPTITWWKGGIQITDTRETTSPDTNTTTSILTFTPYPEDGGKFLSCRGQQPLIPNSALDDGWKLDIYHIPVVTLELGSNLNAVTIREGSDVYFECNIKSNPWVYRVSWKHNGKIIFNNGLSGTIVSNQSLVLQSVNRVKAGTYTCIGSNREGDGESNAVQLDVKYIPTCKSGQENVYNVARQETIIVSCEIDANPVNNVKFSWKFSNSENNALVLDMPQNLITTNKTKSWLSYTPMTERDYGTLLCRGTNKIGQQRDPCVFHINPAGKPDPLSNCTVINQTLHSIQVECIEGFNGGLQQTFILEVYDIYLNKLITNISTKHPEFFVSGLNSDTKLNLVIYALNKKGRSEIRNLQTHTIRSNERFVDTTNAFIQLTPILGVLVGIVVTLILTATIIVIIIRLRGGQEDDKGYDGTSVTPSGSAYFDGSSKNTSSVALRTGVNDSVNSLEEKNPDIIPLNNVEEEYQQEERDFEYLSNMPTRTYIKLPVPNQIDGEEYIRQADVERTKTIPHVFHNIQPDAYLQPFNATATLQRMQYQLPSYISRRTRENHNEYVTAATPLISREQNVLQPLIVPNTQRTATLKSQTHIVTRF